jgi:hypothetical protein
MRGTLLLLFLLACDSNDGGLDAATPPLDGGTDSGVDGGVDDVGTQDTGVADLGPISSDPILERTPDLQYDCAPQLSVTRQVNRGWSGNYGQTYDLVEYAGDAVLGRIEFMGDPFNPTSTEALISTMASDGTLGTAVEIEVPMPEMVESVAMASVEDGVLFAYVDPSGAYIAKISGTTAEPPKPVLTPGGVPTRVKIATGGERGAILLAVRGADERISYLLQTIDTTGAPTGQSYEVARGARPYLDPGAAIVATSNGWAVAWRNTVTDAGEIYFRLFASNGMPAAEEKKIFEGEENQVGNSVGFDQSTIALLALGDDLLVGWVESQPGDYQTNSGAYAMVALAKVDADGDKIGEHALLQAPELEFNHVEPELFRYEDQVALTWSKGDHIYICAGCVPNHAVRLVLLDPVRMIPVSEVVEIDDDQGGILNRTAVTVGQDILTAFRIVYHVTSEAGLAAFRCTPQ